MLVKTAVKEADGAKRDENPDASLRIEVLNAAGEIQEHRSPADQLQALRHIR
jgi:hypothetical protein